MTTKTPKRMEISAHCALGTKLKESASDLAEAQALLFNAYGQTNRLSALAKSALEALNKLRSKLDEQVISENPDAPDSLVLHAYYGDASVTVVPSIVGSSKK